MLKSESATSKSILTSPRFPCSCFFQRLSRTLYPDGAPVVVHEAFPLLSPITKNSRLFMSTKEPLPFEPSPIASRMITLVDVCPRDLI